MVVSMETGTPTEQKPDSDDNNTKSPASLSFTASFILQDFLNWNGGLEALSESVCSRLL